MSASRPSKMPSQHEDNKQGSKRRSSKRSACDVDISSSDSDDKPLIRVTDDADASKSRGRGRGEGGKGGDDRSSGDLRLRSRSARGNKQNGRGENRTRERRPRTNSGVLGSVQRAVERRADRDAKKHVDDDDAMERSEVSPRSRRDRRLELAAKRQKRFREKEKTLQDGRRRGEGDRKPVDKVALKKPADDDSSSDEDMPASVKKADHLQNIALTHLKRGEAEAALEAVVEALELVQDKQGQASCLNIKAEAYRTLGRFDEAIATAKDACAIWRSCCAGTAANALLAALQTAAKSQDAQKVAPTASVSPAPSFSSAPGMSLPTVDGEESESEDEDDDKKDSDPWLTAVGQVFDYRCSLLAASFAVGLTVGLACS